MTNYYSFLPSEMNRTSNLMLSLVIVSLSGALKCVWSSMRYAYTVASVRVLEDISLPSDSRKRGEPQEWIAGI